MGVLAAFVAITAFFVVSRRRSRDNLNRFGNSSGRITPESELLDAGSVAGAVGGKARDLQDHHHHQQQHNNARRFGSLDSDSDASELEKAYYRPNPGARETAAADSTRHPIDRPRVALPCMPRCIKNIYIYMYS